MAVADVERELLVELADGTCGYGEAAPFSAFNGETQDLARAAIETARGAVEGADAREWRLIAGKLHSTIGPVGSAQCAIETAILDALTRHGRMPLWAFFGGASTSLETDMTITTGTAAQAADLDLPILHRYICGVQSQWHGQARDFNDSVLKIILAGPFTRPVAFLSERDPSMQGTLAALP